MNIRIKFYEREKNIRLSFIRQEQYRLERVRTSIFQQAAKRMQIKKQNIPVWMSPRPKTGAHLRQMTIPELIFPDWEIYQSERLPPLSTTKVIRRHSAR